MTTGEVKGECPPQLYGALLRHPVHHFVFLALSFTVLIQFHPCH